MDSVLTFVFIVVIQVIVVTVVLRERRAGDRRRHSERGEVCRAQHRAGKKVE